MTKNKCLNCDELTKNKKYCSYKFMIISPYRNEASDIVLKNYGIDD